jgi:RimJ/RimL family protein N-acetyltransferase
VTVLTTARLTLAPHTADDFADVAAMWGDPHVTRHIGGRPFTEEESWAQGRGFASESLTAAHDWIGARRTVCLIDPANGASIRLAERHGYQAFAEARYKGTPTRLFERKPS